MKIVLQQGEFEKMAEAWVYENLIEKKMASATIVNDSIELEVFGDGSSKETIEEQIIEEPEEEFYDKDDD